MKNNVEKYLKSKGKNEKFIRLIITILEKENVANCAKMLQKFYNSL